MRRLLLALACCGSFAAAAEERVLDFASRIAISPDGALEVLETIVVQAEGRQIRRGIFRDFPTDYRDRYGNKVSVPFEVREVKRDGAPSAYALERQANGMRIRIGEASVFLTPGRHVYEVRYRSARQVGFFAQHDELYWNVNGNGWTLPFDRVSAEVSLPQAAPPGRLAAEAYTGAFGERGRDYVAQTSAQGAAFRSTRPFAAGEGMTIVFAFPKGIVAEPSAWQRLAWLLADNRGLALGILGFGLLLAFLYWRWSLVGRDPRAGPRFPRYEAPAGLGPAAVRYVDRMAYDDRCFAAALLGLGQRGYLKIRNGHDDYDVELIGAPVAWLPGEEQLAQALFAGGRRSLRIQKAHNPVVQAARDALGAVLDAQVQPKLFSRNRGSLGFGVVLALATLGGMLGLDASGLALGTSGAVMGVMLIVFAWLLPAYSVAGRKLQDAIEGLRQYLSVAEKDDLARMQAPPQTAEEFSRFLPYAVALEVEQTWAERFARIIGPAALASATSGYYSGTASSRGPGEFASSLAAMGSVISAASTPPGSSSGSSGGGGGGGGGSSGGGGGGGGGGGW